MNSTEKKIIGALTRLCETTGLLADCAERHTGGTLFILFLISVIVKLTACWLAPSIGRDAALYLHMANCWLETGSYNDVIRQIPGVRWVPPMLLFLMKILMQSGMSAEMAGYAVNVISGSLITPVGFGIALEATGNKKTALTTALLLAVHPMVSASSTEILRDIPYLFFSGCTAWLVLAGLRRGNAAFWCSAGMFFAFALLTRYETLELLLPIPLAVLVFVLKRRLSWKRALLSGAGFLVCGLIVFYTMLFLMGSENFISAFSGRVNQNVAFVEKRMFGLPKKTQGR